MFKRINDKRIKSGYSINELGLIKDIRGNEMYYRMCTTGEPKISLRTPLNEKLDVYINKLLINAFRPRNEDDKVLIFTKDKSEPMSLENLCYSDDEGADAFKTRKTKANSRTNNGRRKSSVTVMDEVAATKAPRVYSHKKRAYVSEKVMTAALNYIFNEDAKKDSLDYIYHNNI